MKVLPKLHTQQTVLCLLSPDQASLMLDYYLQNRQHLIDWEPGKPDDFYSIPYWENRLTIARSQFINQQAVHFSIMNEQSTEVIGICNFSNIVLGAFMACHLGFSISYKHQNKGLMSEAIHAASHYMFNTVGLHRIMANYQPHNKASKAVLTKSGFVQEGFAKDYLKINGEWRDHVLTSKISPII